MIYPFFIQPIIMIYIFSGHDSHYFYNKDSNRFFVIFYDIIDYYCVIEEQEYTKNGKFVKCEQFEYELPLPTNIKKRNIINMEILREKVFEISLNKLL